MHARRRWAIGVLFLGCVVEVAACGSSEKSLRPRMPTSDKPVGIGALLRVGNTPEGKDLIVIDKVVVGGPADLAGVRANDGIWTIDGADAKDFDLMDVVKRIRGEEGTPVVLGLGPNPGELRVVSVTRGEADPNRIDCFEGECQNGRGVRKDAFGDLYEGDFVAGKPQGQGKLTERSGRVYTGAFVDGAPHGQGELVMPDGLKVSGVFQYGELRGPGKIMLVNGDLYEGMVDKLAMSGQGKLTRPATGDVWSGTFKFDHLVDGEWTHVPGSDGRRCTRAMKEGAVAAAGVIIYAADDKDGRVKFEGPFGDDCVANGAGGMTYKGKKKPVKATYADDKRVR